MGQNEIMSRLQRLERKVHDLQKQINTTGSKPKKSWRDFVGMFKNDADFAAAVQSGSRWRRSGRKTSPQ